MKDSIKTSSLSIILAALFLSVFGAIWYAVLFNDINVKAHRYTSEDYMNSSPLWYIGGVLISLLIAWGIGYIIRLRGATGAKAGAKAAFTAILGFGLPLVSYPLVFSPLHDVKLYAVGVSQIVIAWLVTGAIIGAMAKKIDR